MSKSEKVREEGLVLSVSSFIDTGVKFVCF